MASQIRMECWGFKLAEAISAGDKELIKDIISSKEAAADIINQHLYSGQTPLLLAISNNQEAIVCLLLELGAKVGLVGKTKPVDPDVSGHTPELDVYPLQKAYEMKTMNMIEILLKYGANVSQCSGQVKGLLYLAVMEGNANAVTMLVEQSQEEGMMISRSVNLSEPLKAAVLQGDMVMVQHLLNLKANVNEQIQGVVPIVLAAQKQNIRMCMMLINNGAILNEHSGTLGTMETPLSMAIGQGMDKAVDVLLQLGCNPNVAVDWSTSHFPIALRPGSSMLHFAVVKNSLRTVRTLVAAGADINRGDCEGNSPLHVACTMKNEPIAIVKYLVNYKDQIEDMKYLSPDLKFNTAEINCVNKKKQTALMHAARCGLDELVQILLNAGVDSNMVDASRETAIHCALASHSEGIMKKLLISGCNPNGAAGKNNVSPLHKAVTSGDVILTEMLLERGASLTLMPYTAETLLHSATTGSSLELVQLFLSKGLSINFVNSRKETALMLAGRQKNNDITKLLLEKGAALDMCDKNGETALSLSVYFGYDESSWLLIAHGADINLADRRCTTPVYWAMFNHRPKVLRLLFDAGVDFTRKDMHRYPRNLSIFKEESIQTWIKHCLSEPPPLRWTCRNTIRRSLIQRACGRSILKAVHRLLLPESIRDYIMMYVTRPMASLMDSFGDLSLCGKM